MKNKPRYSSIYSPNDYDIATQMEDMVWLANKREESFCSVDVGKIVGLYLDWLEMKKNLCNIEKKTKKL